MKLRDQVLKLAAENEDLRSDLMPLIFKHITAARAPKEVLRIVYEQAKELYRAGDDDVERYLVGLLGALGTLLRRLRYTSEANRLKKVEDDIAYALELWEPDPSGLGHDDERDMPYLRAAAEEDDEEENEPDAWLLKADNEIYGL